MRHVIMTGLWLGLLVLGCRGSSGPVEPPQPDSLTIVAEPKDEAAYIYAQDALRTYELTIAEDDLAAIDADPAAEVYVPGTLRFEGKTYGPVAVRYKGSVGAFLPPCAGGGAFGGGQPSPKVGKCSVKISFNAFEPAVPFFGLRKLQFHAMNADRSFLRERLAYKMFRDSGVPAPRSVHARLIINGRFEGLFALVEQIDGRFTRSRFGDGGEGNLYKEIWPLHQDESAYLAALETNEDDSPSAAGFVAFHKAVGQGAERLAEHLDFRAMLTFLAVDRVIMNDDGPMHFWCFEGGQGNNPGGRGNHNYYWYQAVDRDFFSLIPWDMDYSFSGRSFVRIDPEWRQEVEECQCIGTLIPASCDPLVKVFIALPAAYEARVDDFIAGPFEKSRVDALLEQWSEQIAPAVEEEVAVQGAGSAAEWREQVDQLRSLVDDLREHRGYDYFP